MRKVLAALFTPVLVAGVLAGCGSSEKTSTTSTTSTSASSTIPTQTVDSEIAAKVPSKYKSKGTLVIATEAEYAPNEFIARRPHDHRHGPRPDDRDRRSHGAESVTSSNAELRSDHPRARGRQVRRRGLIVHRHEGTPEGRRTSSTTSRPASRSTPRPRPTRASKRSPTCAARQSPSRRAPSRKKKPKQAEQGLRQRRQEGRDGAQVFPGQNAGQPRRLQRPRGTRHGRLAGRRLPGQAVQRRVQAHRQDATQFAPYGMALPKGQRHGAADSRGAGKADRERHVHQDPRRSGASRRARSPNRRSTARS